MMLHARVYGTNKQGSEKSHLMTWAINFLVFTSFGYSSTAVLPAIF